jgi:hypothetical protein
MTTELPEVPAIYVWFSVLAIVLAFGIVGRMDYEDALAQERAEGRGHWKFLCRPSALDSTVDDRVLHLRNAVIVADYQPLDAAEDEPQRVLRCIVLNE